jgi:hypothetical protein
MSDTERVRAWRQRLKDSGLIAVTLWLRPETKARYEDLALQSHRSLSEVAQLALDAYRLDPALVSVQVTNIEQIRSIIREEMDEAMAIITATITAMVTDTAKGTLPALVEEALTQRAADTITETETATPQAPRAAAPGETPGADTATATETATQGEPRVAATKSASGADTATVATTETARTQGGQRKLTPLQAAELRGKRAAGMPIKALMQAYGLSRATLHRYLSAPPGA